VGLTSGTGPFGKAPDGRFNFEPGPPGTALYWHPVPYRVRALVGGETVVDSRRAHLLHETGHLPVYYFPPEDVRDNLLEPSEHRTHCPYKGDASYRSIRIGDRLVEDALWEYPNPIPSARFLTGFAACYWNKLDEWFVEDDQAFGHPRDPFHRIDVYDTTRHVRVLLEGRVLAESRRAKMLVETGLPARYYLPLADVDDELLTPSATKTRCAYKGSASHFHALGHEDVAWTYAEPDHDGERIRDAIAFYQERVDLVVDGEPQVRPTTQWSR
jgi:uncharacterized protein (DUF427 family)